MNSQIKMKLINSIIICCVLSLLLNSCNKDSMIAEETVTFTDNNWDYEQRTINFKEVNIQDIEAPYEIEVELDYQNTAPEYRVNEMAIVLTITAPDGAEYFANSAFVFSTKDNSIKNSGSQIANKQTKILYPKKYFNTTGNYKFKLYRHSEKFDNYGMNALTFRIKKLKIE